MRNCFLAASRKIGRWGRNNFLTRLPFCQDDHRVFLKVLHKTEVELGLLVISAGLLGEAVTLYWHLSDSLWSSVYDWGICNGKVLGIFTWLVGGFCFIVLMYDWSVGKCSRDYSSSLQSLHSSPQTCVHYFPLPLVITTRLSVIIFRLFSC